MQLRKSLIEDRREPFHILLDGLSTVLDVESHSHCGQISHQALPAPRSMKRVERAFNPDLFLSTTGLARELGVQRYHLLAWCLLLTSTRTSSIDILDNARIKRIAMMILSRITAVEAGQSFQTGRRDRVVQNAGHAYLEYHSEFLCYSSRSTVAVTKRVNQTGGCSYKNWSDPTIQSTSSWWSMECPLRARKVL